MTEDQKLDVISNLLAIIDSLDCHEVTCGCAIFQAPESIIDDMDTVCAQARKLLNEVK